MQTNFPLAEIMKMNFDPTKEYKIYFGRKLVALVMDNPKVIRETIRDGFPDLMAGEFKTIKVTYNNETVIKLRMA